jgi:hypothetical protein
MNRYWLKIGVGALAVFAVGLVIWSMVERGVHEVQDLAGSDRAISIPLLGIVPFNVEGRQAGRIDRITLLRDAPKQISGVVVRVGRADSLPADAFAGCTFTVRDPAHLDENTEFRCLREPAQLAGFESFGEVRIATPGGVIVRRIVLPSEVIADLRDPSNFDANVEGGQLEDEAAAAVADSIGAAMEQFADSVSRAATLHAESLTAEGKKRAEAAAARVRAADAGAHGGSSTTVKVGP